MGARVVRDGKHLAVQGGGRIAFVGGRRGREPEFVYYGSRDGSALASIASLRQALSRALRAKQKKKGYYSEGVRGAGGRIWVGFLDWPEDELQRTLQEVDDEVEFRTGQFLDLMDCPPTSPCLFFEQDRLSIRVEAWRPDEPDLGQVRDLLAPFLEHRDAEGTITSAPDPDHEGFHLSLDVAVEYPRGATVADALRLGEEANALLEVARGEELPREVVIDLLRARRWDLFHGQRESDWLEAKGEPYDHLSDELGDNWRFELAKDVAAFANSPDGGIIVIGLTTKNKGDGDTINGYNEFALDRVLDSTYRKHVDQIVYPRLVGFEVIRVPGKTKGQGIAILLIPPQPAASRPFLVNGTILERKLMGSHVLLPTRLGDDSAFLDAGAIHARLRLGEQSLAGEDRR